MLELLTTPRLRRVAALTAATLYFVIDMVETVVGEPAADAEMAGLVNLHHVLQAVVFGLVVWALWAEIRERTRAETALVASEARHDRLSRDVAGHISRRFEDWQLTSAETDIAWLLIKGFTFSEIAGMRGVKEKTLRQQASQVYAKAGVKGRTELSAAFLEDLIGEAA